jgi:hypothetical protein
MRDGARGWGQTRKEIYEFLNPGFLTASISFNTSFKYSFILANSSYADRNRFWEFFY